MDREAVTDQKQSKAQKAKLDSKGRPIVVKAPETDKRADGAQGPVQVAVRLGAILLALTTQSGCEPDAVEQPAAIERAVAKCEAAALDAWAAAGDAADARSAALAIARSASSIVCVESTCDDLPELLAEVTRARRAISADLGAM